MNLDLLSNISSKKILFKNVILCFTDHVRTGSGVSLDGCEITHYSSNDSIRLEWKYTARAHPQPLTCLDCQSGRILTGSHVSIFKASTKLKKI